VSARALSALLLLGLLLHGAVSWAQEAEAEITISAVNASQHPTVTLEVLVPTSLATTTLSAEAFSIVEADVERSASVAQVRGDELDVVLLMDTTGSMGGGPLDEAKTAAASFLQKLPQGTSVAVLGYDTTARVVSEFSPDLGAHVNALAALEASGRTALYDALHTALDLLEGRSAEHRALVLLTDGEDNASTTTLAETAARLEVTQVTLHGIEYRTAYTDAAGLGTLVGATGGQVVRADDPAALAAVYTDIAAALSNRYTLTYRSAAGGPTEVSVTVQHEGQQARASRVIELPAAPATPTEPAAAPQEGTVLRLSTFDRPWVLVAGASAIFASFALTLLILFAGRSRRIQLSSEARETAVSPGFSSLTQSLVVSAERSLERHGRRQPLNQRLERAGVQLRAGEYLILLVAAAITAAGSVGMIGGPLAAAVAASLVLVGARVLLSSRIERRRAAFAGQLPDTIQLLTGSLRAGYGLMHAIDVVSRETESPTAEEFRRLLVEVRLGRDVQIALQEMAERIGLDDFHWVVQAFGIHTEVGGNLAAVLDEIGETIRQRDTVRRQISVLSAEGRLSMWVLITLPFVTALGLSLIQDNYVAIFTETSAGIVLLGLGGVLILVGGLWIRRVVRLVF
jgi:tight adherence protein B